MIPLPHICCYWMGQHKTAHIKSNRQNVLSFLYQKQRLWYKSGLNLPHSDLWPCLKQTDSTYCRSKSVLSASCQTQSGCFPSEERRLRRLPGDVTAQRLIWVRPLRQLHSPFPTGGPEQAGKKKPTAYLSFLNPDLTLTDSSFLCCPWLWDFWSCINRRTDLQTWTNLEQRSWLIKKA